jgi:hypothetical protein
MEEHERCDFGDRVAARLRGGSGDDYELLQDLVVRAQKTQDWVYGDMVMRIIWALLPEEAQNKINEQMCPDELRRNLFPHQS